MMKNILSRKTLREFWEIPKYKDSEEPLKVWYDEVSKASWQTPNDVKKQFGNASIVGNSKIVFNIKGNDYRLVVEINYKFQYVYVLWIGTHTEYDKIDVTKI
jgi:mRNA interferase HigB